MKIRMTNTRGTEPERDRRLPMPVVVVTLLAVGTFGLASCGNDDSGDPGAALNAYANGINAGSMDDVMALFADGSRIIDHPLSPGESNGKTEIRRGMQVTVGSARVPDAYSISDVMVDGDTVSWSYVWVNNGGDEFCATGNELDVDQDGLIVEMRWGPDQGECGA